jgi:glutamate racemase
MIGVFDSGFGGLTVLKSFLRKLPRYDYVYLGDNARAPYGNKSQGLIYKYTVQAVDFLFKEGAELVVIACNTASAEALRKIQQEWLPKNYPERRVLGVVVPVVEEAIKSNKGDKIGVIGTRSTVASKTYGLEIKKINPGVVITQKETPLLVPLIEEGYHRRKEAKMILRTYLKPLKDKKVDKLILGCTHYPILQKEIVGIMGKNCVVLDSPGIVAKKLDDYLKGHSEIENKIRKKRQRKYFTTDDIRRFEKLGQKFLGESIQGARKIELK